MELAYTDTAGAVIIDRGAHSVLSCRESGGRLLVAGVLGVRGAFASGQAVRILVRKKAAGGISEDTEAAREEYVCGLAPTQPGTPLATDIVGQKLVIHKTPKAWPLLCCRYMHVEYKFGKEKKNLHVNLEKKNRLESTESCDQVEVATPIGKARSVRSNPRQVAA